MTLGLIALGLCALWLLVLTVLQVLTVRQIALVTAQLDSAGRHAMPQQEVAHDVLNDGLSVGSPVPAEVLDAIPEAAGGAVYVFLISASCRTCRMLAADIEDQRPTFAGPIVALVPGPPSAAREIAAMLPVGTRTIYDPVAGPLAQTHLAVSSTPFILRLERRQLTAKSFVATVADLTTFAARHPLVAAPDSSQQATSAAESASPARKEWLQHAH